MTHHFRRLEIIKDRSLSCYSLAGNDKFKKGLTELIYKKYNGKQGGIEKQGLPDPYLGY